MNIHCFSGIFCYGETRLRLCALLIQNCRSLICSIIQLPKINYLTLRINDYKPKSNIQILKTN